MKFPSIRHHLSHPVTIKREEEKCLSKKTIFFSVLASIPATIFAPFAYMGITYGVKCYLINKKNSAFSKVDDVSERILSRKSSDLSSDIPSEDESTSSSNEADDISDDFLGDEESMEPETQLDDVPDEVIELILLSMKGSVEERVRAIVNFGATAKRYHAITQGDGLWIATTGLSQDDVRANTKGNFQTYHLLKSPVLNCLQSIFLKKQKKSTISFNTLISIFKLAIKYEKNLAKLQIFFAGVFYIMGKLEHYQDSWDLYLFDLIDLAHSYLDKFEDIAHTDLFKKIFIKHIYSQFSIFVGWDELYERTYLSLNRKHAPYSFIEYQQRLFKGMRIYLNLNSFNYEREKQNQLAVIHSILKSRNYYEFSSHFQKNFPFLREALEFEEEPENLQIFFEGAVGSLLLYMEILPQGIHFTIECFLLVNAYLDKHEDLLTNSEIIQYFFNTIVQERFSKIKGWNEIAERINGLNAQD